MTETPPPRNRRGSRWPLLALVVLVGPSLPLFGGAAPSGAGPTASRPRPDTTRSTRSRRRGEPLQVISLPQPKTEGTLPVETALSQVQTLRPMTGETLDSNLLGQLAWAAQLRQGPKPESEPRTRMALHFVTGAGVFSYQVQGHQLWQISALDRRMELVLNTVDPRLAGAVGCVVVVSGPTRGASARDTLRVRRLSLLDAGRIAQNIRLQALGLNLAVASVEAPDPDRVRPLLDLSRGLEPEVVLFLGHRQQTASAAPGTPVHAVKRVIFVVPPVGFLDTELVECQRILTLAGFQTAIASTRRGVVTGSLGQVAHAGLALADVSVRHVDALVFLGGPGSAVLAAQAQALALAQRARQRGLLIGATGSAVTLLAQAGLLQGLRVAAPEAERPRLQNSGATVTGSPVERDGAILTTRGSGDVTAFARLLANALAER